MRIFAIAVAVAVALSLTRFMPVQVRSDIGPGDRGPVGRTTHWLVADIGPGDR